MAPLLSFGAASEAQQCIFSIRIAGAAGTTMALYALRGGVVGLLLGSAGALILLRTTINKPIKRLVGMTRNREIDVRS